MPIRRNVLVLGSVLSGLGLLWFGAPRWVGPGAAVAAVQEQAPTRRATSISASKFAFAPNRIDVRQGDIVQVTLSAVDIAHSFTIDEYRIAKRAAPGQPVTFEFRADQPGTFRFYCNLKQDEGCRDMHGTLVVR